MIPFSKTAWIISLLVFVILMAAVVLNAYSPGWAIVSGDRVYVNRKAIRLSIPSSAARRGSDGGFISAYDTLISDQANRTVEDRLAHRFWAASFVLHLVSVCSRANASAGIDVEFNDGSKRRYNYDCSTQKYAPVPGTAWDSRLNTIPENPKMAANGGINTYDFSDKNAVYDGRNLKELLARFKAVGNYATADKDITCVWLPSTVPPLQCKAGM